MTALPISSPTGTPTTLLTADEFTVCYAEPVTDIVLPEGLLPVAPDLVVEVRSPSDRWTAVLLKVSEYLRAGVRVVVVLDPATASDSVYRDDQLLQIYHNSDVLTLPEVLAGFSVVVSRLFE